MQFRIDLERAPQRILRVSLTIATADWPERAGEREVFLPVWTPGSYLVREYARHVEAFAPRDAGSGAPLRWRKSAKNRYAVRTEGATSVRIDYEVYAHELTVRTAYVTDAFAYWNGACVLLWPVGMEARAADIAVVLRDGWRLVTGKGDGRSGDGGIASFVCTDLDDAVDTPCLAGPIEELSFEVRGRRHRFCAVGLDGVRLPDGFTADLQRVVETAAAPFRGELPFDEYVFLSLFGGGGRGGLEHASSSTLLAPRTTFQPRGSYEDFLALAAHEYFHVWNVKRMRPAELWSFDYERENHTELLWVAEGFTAYYDDLFVRRAGISSPRRYLDVLGNHVRGMLGMPGRLRQSLCEASFDAWIRFYRPDENTRNSTQNYYANGAIAAFVIDSEIRRISGGARSLDDAVRALWSDTFEQGRGYSYEDVAGAVSAAAGRRLDDLVASLVRAPLEPDLDRGFELFGLRVERGDAKPWIGVQLKSGTTDVASVQRGSPAWDAGICPADEILGVADLRVDGSRFGEVWPLVARVDEALDVLVARQGRILRRRVRPEARTDGDLRIVSVDDPSEAQLAHREAWLGARDVSRSS